MDDIHRLLEDLAHLARLSVAQQTQQVQRLIMRMARSHRKAFPDLSAKLVQLMQEAPTAQSPLRSTEMAVVPVDQDSRLQLVRCEQPVALDIEPVWPQPIAQALQRFCKERHQQERLLEAGVAPSRSLLLVGPPGVGKTLAARWIARELDLPLLTLDLSAVMSSFLGRTGINLRHVMDYAKGIQGVLLLDELDAIAKKRDDVAEVGELKRLVTVILQEIEEWPETGVLLGATNHPALLDPAVWRRFDQVVEFPMPSRDETLALVTRIIGPERANDALRLAASIAMDGESFSDTTRAMQRVLRNATIENTSCETAITELIGQRAELLPKKARAELAAQLTKAGISQRLANELTGVSRDTIRKRLAEDGQRTRKE
jgi:SpoVK/Ycf46/Vps4 family AAA+-type ATPase